MGLVNHIVLHLYEKNIFTNITKNFFFPKYMFIFANKQSTTQYTANNQPVYEHTYVVLPMNTQ